MIEYVHHDLTRYKSIIVFRGGQSGNFLVSLFTEQQYNVKTLTNEYISSVDDVGEFHINLWFQPVTNPEYRNEIYTKYRYRQILEQLSDVPKIVVVNNPTHIHETEFLSEVKGGYYEPSTSEKLKKLNTKWNRYVEKMVAHYDYFEKILRKYNDNVYHLDYKDFFIEQNCKPLFDFMESEDKTHLVKQYHENNRKILNKYGFDFS